MSTVDPTAKKETEEPHTCHMCALRNALIDWRDAGGPVEDVVQTIRAMIEGTVYSVLDDVFEEEKEAPTHAAGHG